MCYTGSPLLKNPAQLAQTGLPAHMMPSANVMGRMYQPFMMMNPFAPAAFAGGNILPTPTGAPATVAPTTPASVTADPFVTPMDALVAPTVGPTCPLPRPPLAMPSANVKAEPAAQAVAAAARALTEAAPARRVARGRRVARTGVKDSSASARRVTSRKERHQKIEKRRRDAINECVKELRRLVPDVGKADWKSSVLEKTVDYVKELHRALELAQVEIDRLRKD